MKLDDIFCNKPTLPSVLNKCCQIKYFANVKVTSFNILLIIRHTKMNFKVKPDVLDNCLLFLVLITYLFCFLRADISRDA